MYKRLNPWARPVMTLGHLNSLPKQALVFTCLQYKCFENTLSQNKPWFLRVCSTSVLKTLWEKEKLLVTSNFSFSLSVFYLFEEFSAIFVKFEIVVCNVFQFGRVQNLPFGKGLSFLENL